MSAPATDLVEKFVAGFIDAILDFTLPADSCGTHVGAGSTAGGGTLPLPAHSNGGTA